MSKAHYNGRDFHSLQPHKATKSRTFREKGAQGQTIMSIIANLMLNQDNTSSKYRSEIVDKF